MREIKLVDYNPPFLQSKFRTFLFDVESGKSIDKYEVQDKERFRGASGWGSKVALGNRETLLAIYVLDRTLKLWIDGRSFEAAEVTDSVVRELNPLTKNFHFKIGNENINCHYVHSWEEEDNDLFVLIDRTLRYPLKLKEFAFRWSAWAAGYGRPLSKYGLTAEDLDQIDDPYDLNVQVSDF